MSVKTNPLSANQVVRTLRTVQRFTLGQRWEHGILIVSVLVQLLTGLPQKFRAAIWSQNLLTSPQRVETVQQIHHIAAIVLFMVIAYHLGKILIQLARRKLPGDMLPTWKDVTDAWQMFLYLIYLKKEKPAFGKYNFEQKFTYWFLFFGIGILGISGLILWFPEFFTRFLPGGLIPAAKLAHSSEAIAAAVFIFLWHFFHVHIERLNLSIFTGWLNEEELSTYHSLEYQRTIAAGSQDPKSGEKKS